MRLSGRVAIISGAGSGIGRASALLFAREGAFVALVDRDAAGAETTLSMPVCTENLIRVDDVMESPKLAE